MQMLSEGLQARIFSQLSMASQRSLASACPYRPGQPLVFRRLWLQQPECAAAWREQHLQAAQASLAARLSMETMQRTLQADGQQASADIIHFKLRLVLGQRELAYVGQRAVHVLEPLSLRLARLIASRISSVLVPPAWDDPSLLSLTVSHYRSMPLSEEEVQCVELLVSKIPGVSVDTVAEAFSGSEFRCEAVCWLRLASTSDCQLPVHWVVPEDRTFDNRHRLGSLGHL